jgi:hypothetical protein
MLELDQSRGHNLVILDRCINWTTQGGKPNWDIEVQYLMDTQLDALKLYISLKLLISWLPPGELFGVKEIVCTAS